MWYVIYANLVPFYAFRVSSIDATLLVQGVSILLCNMTLGAFKCHLHDPWVHLFMEVCTYIHTCVGKSHMSIISFRFSSLWMPALPIVIKSYFGFGVSRFVSRYFSVEGSQSKFCDWQKILEMMAFESCIHNVCTRICLADEVLELWTFVL